jgi:hypothetical protein
MPALRTIGFCILTATVILFDVVRAQPPAATPLVGAIRWDAWQENGTVNAAVEATLGPEHWHYRLPFFSQVLSTNRVDIDGNRQSVLDQEIIYAANAGIAYWAFVTYPDGIGMSNGLHLYLNSSQRSLINFCLILQGGWISDPGAWNAEVERYVSYFREPAYQNVLGNRPLVYLFNAQGMIGPGKYTNWSAVHAAFEQLRTAATGAGAGSPYIVVQGWSAAADKAIMQNIGADAIGAYAVGGGTTSGSPYATLAAAAHSFWDADKSTGANVIPIITSGWDNRPRAENPTPWDAGGWNYFQAPTPAELTTHVSDALGWTSANRCAAAPANTVLTYAWNEHDEGGWISPTLGSVPGTADTTRLDALQTAIAHFTATGPLVNTSLELPSATSGWYIVPTSGMPAAFGWWNNFAPGSYVLATSSALHFSKAAAGSQALLLSTSRSISQSLGRTLADATYRLKFSLLHDNYNGGTGGTIHAEILDCGYVIGAGDFSVPAKRNAWQTYTVTGRSPHAPAGILSIKFTGTSGMPWLDNVSLSPP